MMKTKLSAQSKSVCATIILAATFCAGLWPLAASAQDATNAPSGPTVTTDRSDYAPFSYVTITGPAFQPGETADNHTVHTPRPPPATPYSPTPPTPAAT